MVTYEVKINGQVIKRVDARRMHARNKAMDELGYAYSYKVYDYENESFAEGIIDHRYDDGAGKLLELIWADYFFREGIPTPSNPPTP